MSKKLPSVTVNLRTLAMILVREYGIRQGEWQVGVGFAFDARYAKLGQSQEMMPCAQLGVQNVVLFRVEAPTEVSVSAEAINAPAANVPAPALTQ